MRHHIPIEIGVPYTKTQSLHMRVVVDKENGKIIIRNAFWDIKTEKSKKSIELKPIFSAKEEFRQVKDILCFKG